LKRLSIKVTSVGNANQLAYADLGYRGHTYKGKADIFLPRDKSVTSPAIKRERKRRSAIEPIIGHLKNDGLLERNHLKGAYGDAINAILCAIGHNMRLLAAWLKLLWRALLRFIENPAQNSLAPA
jgi:IS5 family transposase